MFKSFFGLQNNSTHFENNHTASITGYFCSLFVLSCSKSRLFYDMLTDLWDWDLSQHTQTHTEELKVQFAYIEPRSDNKRKGVFS